MAAYTVVTAKYATLTASTVDTITLTKPRNFIEVVNRGAAEIYFTADGTTTPTVGGDNTYMVQAGGSLCIDDGGGDVKLISSGATAYSVRAF